MADTRTIAITRSQSDAAEFVELAEKNGMRPLPLPTIRLVSKGPSIVDEFLASIRARRPDYTVFMSSKAASLLFETARQCSKLEDLRLAVANTTVVAVGPKTRAALEREGIQVNAMPERIFSSVGIGEVFTSMNAAGKSCIIPRSSASTPFLKELLCKIGMDVLEIHLYDVRASDDSGIWDEFRDLLAQGKIDGIIFTSASSVRGFFDIMAKSHESGSLAAALSGLRVVAIGPFTADELAKYDVRHVTSGVHTVAGSFHAMNAELSDSGIHGRK